MAAKKKTEKPAEKPAKVPSLNKDGTPRAKPVRLPPMDAFLAKVARYVKDETAAVAKAAKLNATFALIEAALKAWGKLPGENLSGTEILGVATKLKDEGFTPPKGRVHAEPFKEGDAVQLKADFVTAYQSVYSDEEIGSMVYGFRDDVNKRDMCTTDGRVMAVKPSHIEARAVTSEAAAE